MRPSTLVPDTLAGTTVTPLFDSIGDGASFALADATNPIDVYTVDADHADDMLMVLVGDALFNTDLYTPGNGGSAFSPADAQALQHAITSNGLTVNTLIGGHGAIAPLSELQAFLNP